MQQIKLKAKEFKKMSDPNMPDSKHVKYVCYVQAKSIPQELDQWMGTNPREQKMTTNVAIKIKNSLADNENFHELIGELLYLQEMQNGITEQKS